MDGLSKGMNCVSPSSCFMLLSDLGDIYSVAGHKNVGVLPLFAQTPIIRMVPHGLPKEPALEGDAFDTITLFDLVIGRLLP